MKLLVNSEQAITNIANAIRSKTGSTAQMTVKDMPTAIANISAGGTVTTNVEVTDSYSDCMYVTPATFDAIVEYCASGLHVKLNYVNGTGDPSYDHTYDGIDWYVADVIPDYRVQSGYSFNEMAAILVLLYYYDVGTYDRVQGIYLLRNSE